MSAKNTIVTKNGVDGKNANGSAVELVNGRWQLSGSSESDVTLGRSGPVEPIHPGAAIDQLAEAVLGSDNTGVYTTINTNQAEGLMGALDSSSAEAFASRWNELSNAGSLLKAESNYPGWPRVYRETIEDLANTSPEGFFESLDFELAQSFADVALAHGSPHIAGSFISAWAVKNPEQAADTNADGSVDGWLALVTVTPPEPFRQPGEGSPAPSAVDRRVGLAHFFGRFGLYLDSSNAYVKQEPVPENAKSPRYLVPTTVMVKAAGDEHAGYGRGLSRRWLRVYKDTTDPQERYFTGSGYVRRYLDEQGHKYVERMLAADDAPAA